MMTNSNVVDFNSALKQRALRSPPPSNFVPYGVSRRIARLIADRRPLDELTETAKNQKLRAQREEPWRKAEMTTRYLRAKIDYDEVCIIAAKHGIIPSLGLYEVDDGMLNVRKWREAQVAQLLTPAPTVAAITWKRQAFAGGQYRFTDVKAGAIERAIDLDAAWLAAHPMRRPRPAREPEIAS